MKKFITVIFILLTMNELFAQKQVVDSLYKEWIKPIPIEKVYGHYQKPKTLLQLMKLKQEGVDFNIIGFDLHEDKPYIPAPIDIIPFAHTGGDGCFFAFLTDFGYYKDLEQAPVIFISPTDGEGHRNKLFAKNITDFVSIMLKIKYAEMIRFKDLKTMDFENQITMMEKEWEQYDNTETKEKRKETIDLISKSLKINKIDSLNSYYINFEKDRSSSNFVACKDDIGFKTNIQEVNKSVDFSNFNMLERALSASDFLQREKFYREAPYTYNYTDGYYENILKIIIKYLKQDNFTREAEILQFEQNKNEVSKKYFEEDGKLRKLKRN